MERLQWYELAGPKVRAELTTKLQEKQGRGEGGEGETEKQDGESGSRLGTQATDKPDSRGQCKARQEGSKLKRSRTYVNP